MMHRPEITETLACPRCATEVAINWPNPRLQGEPKFKPNLITCPACSRRLKHKDLLIRGHADLDKTAKLSTDAAAKRAARRASR